MVSPTIGSGLHEPKKVEKPAANLAQVPYSTAPRLQPVLTVVPQTRDEFNPAVANIKSEVLQDFLRFFYVIFINDYSNQLSGEASPAGIKRILLHQHTK